MDRESMGICFWRHFGSVTWVTGQPVNHVTSLNIPDLFKQKSKLSFESGSHGFNYYTSRDWWTVFLNNIHVGLKDGKISECLPTACQYPSIALHSTYWLNSPDNSETHPFKSYFQFQSIPGPTLFPAGVHVPPPSPFTASCHPHIHTWHNAFHISWFQVLMKCNIYLDNALLQPICSSPQCTSSLTIHSQLSYTHPYIAECISHLLILGPN